MSDKVSHFRQGKQALTSGGGGSDLEARLAKLEADVGHIQTDVRDIKVDVKDLRKDMREDFRILFGSLIVVALGLAALMAHAFGWLK